MTFEMRRKTGLLFFIYASNEPKSVLARDLGDRRDNLRNSWSVFLIVVLTATVIITCAGCLGGQQKYNGHSVLGGFSKVSQKAFSKVLFHPDLQKKPMIALTFDDGPSEYTVELSRGLKERGVQATFFLLGENMEGRRKMVEELVKDGHLIGNHSYHHVQLNKLSIEEATGEIEKTNRLIREWTGEAPVYIRPPYGAWSQELEKVVDMIPVFWNVDSLDWKLQNKEQVLSCLSGQVKEGDVILMHDGYRSSVDAAFALVDHLQKQGFVFVNVEEMVLE